MKAYHHKGFGKRMFEIGKAQVDYTSAIPNSVIDYKLHRPMRQGYRLYWKQPLRLMSVTGFYFFRGCELLTVWSCFSLKYIRNWGCMFTGKYLSPVHMVRFVCGSCPAKLSRYFSTGSCPGVYESSCLRIWAGCSPMLYLVPLSTARGNRYHTFRLFPTRHVRSSFPFYPCFQNGLHRVYRWSIISDRKTPPETHRLLAPCWMHNLWKLITVGYC